MKLSLSSLTLIASAAALSAAALAAPASAAQPGGPENFAMPFKFKRAELDTPEGQKALLSRLSSAVRIKCTPPGHIPAIVTPEIRKCVDVTMRSTIAKINSESLASSYDATYGSRAG